MYLWKSIIIVMKQAVISRNHFVHYVLNDISQISFSSIS